MKKIILAIFIFCMPTVIFAHVKWFAQAETSLPSYKLNDTPVIIAIFLSLIFILVGLYLEKKLKVPEKFNLWIEKLAPKILSIASIGFGLSFIIFSISGFIFAPNLEAIGSLGKIMLSVQALAGAMILLGLYERVGGLLIIILFILGVKEYGALEMIDTLEMVGFAIYAIIIGRPKWKIKDTNIFKKFTHHIHEYGVPILRVGTGLNLIVLGFTEKILNPSLTDNFLSQYHWNFMQILGFEHFTNYWFAFSAGVVEILFGVFLLFGLITRTTIVVLAVFLVTTLVLLGPVELIGHLPHFSIAVVLFILGAGTRLKLTKNPF